MKKATVLLLFLGVALMPVACKPRIDEIIKSVDCKAKITMPSVEARPGETVEVRVKIYECRESTGPQRTER